MDVSIKCIKNNKKRLFIICLEYSTHGGTINIHKMNRKQDVKAHSLTARSIFCDGGVDGRLGEVGRIVVHVLKVDVHGGEGLQFAVRRRHT